MELNWHVGDVVRKIRLSRAMTPAQLAKLAQVHHRTLIKLEAADRGTQERTLKKIALALNVSPKALWTLIPNTTPTEDTRPPDGDDGGHKVLPFCPFPPVGGIVTPHMTLHYDGALRYEAVQLHRPIVMVDEPDRMLGRRMPDVVGRDLTHQFANASQVAAGGNPSEFCYAIPINGRRWRSWARVRLLEDRKTFCADIVRAGVASLAWLAALA